MNNFPSINQDIMGGCSSFLFAPLSDLASVDPITFNTDKSWLEGIGLQTESRLSIKPKKTDNGVVYAVEFAGIYPGNSIEFAQLVDEMQQQRHVLKVKDYDGLYYQIPNMRFSAEFDTDTPKGAKRWTFVFSTQLPEAPTVS